MTTTLFIKANNRQGSVTGRLYDAFLESYRAAHPKDTVIEVDLYKEHIPYLDEVMINGISSLLWAWNSHRKKRL